MYKEHPIDEKLLTAEVLTEIKDYLRDTVCWWSHRTPLDHISSIRDQGIVPQRTEAIWTPKPVEQRFGFNPPVSCFCPVHLSDEWARLSHQKRPLVHLAVQTDDLAFPIGLDWTFPDQWPSAGLISDSDSSLSAPEVFLKAVERAKVLVCYNTIAPEHIRVWLNGNDPKDPSEWPGLRDVPESQIASAYLT